MAEVLTKVIAYGFKELYLYRIEALAVNWNTASMKILERVEFTKEGTLREDYVVDEINENSERYSLLKYEWIKAKNDCILKK